MSLRALLSSRSLAALCRSTRLVRSFTTAPRLTSSTPALRNGFRSGVQFRAFQSSALRAFPAPNEEPIDAELSKKLGEELKLEGNMGEGLEIPASVTDYLENGPFKVTDNPGEREVTLTRQYNNETVTVKFDISFPSFDEDTEEGYPWGDEDEGEGGGVAQEEEEEMPTIDSKSGRVMSKPRQAGSPFMWLLGVKQAGFSPSGGQGVSAKKKKEPKYKEPEPEEDEFPEQEEYDSELTGEEDWDDEESGSNYAPISAKITVNKGNAGTLTVAATCTDAIFVIDQVTFSKNPPASPETAQTTFEEAQGYGGPPWNQLDEELQLLMERYLEERGINTALALFIPDYAELKEQKEYVNWLKNLKAFVDK